MPLDVTSADQWAHAVTARGRPVRRADHAGQQRRRAAPRVARRRDRRRASRAAGGSTASARSSVSRPRCTHLRDADGAAIVNTCSTGAIRPFPNHAAYGSSKWALRGLTQVAAVELAPAGIRVNAVFPGPVETPMLDERTQARLAAHALMGRIGKPDGDRRRGGVPGLRARIVHHRIGTRRRRWADPADRMTTSMAKTLSVGIIGAGPGGLALGIFLRKAGFR